MLQPAVCIRPRGKITATIPRLNSTTNNDYEINLQFLELELILSTHIKRNLEKCF